MRKGDLLAGLAAACLLFGLNMVLLPARLGGGNPAVKRLGDLLCGVPAFLAVVILGVLALLLYRRAG
jgi:hypothetical protein